MSALVNTKSSDEDYLDEDPVISSQQWVCLSIFTPNSIKDPEGHVIKSEHSVRAVKIRGVFQTREKAEKRCEEIRKFDRYHHVFVGEVGKWLPWDDDVEKAEEAVYAEPKLNDMMKAYNESQQKAMEYNEERKMKAHADAAKHKRDTEKRIKKESETNDNIAKNIIETSINQLSANIENDRSKLTELTNEQKVEQDLLDKDLETRQSKENTINKIDEELAKAKALYEDMMNKYNSEKK